MAASASAAARVYNAVYSSVQVFECMVRGIAVMRRRSDSYVNATQILKVAGIDKGRRTKILEKDILPGPHEIVQGGYGKYQGTWIPLERGRDVAAQYGVSALLSPLFDYVPAPAPTSLNSRPLGPSSHPPSSAPSQSSYSFPPAPIISPLPPTAPPGSALRLLAQGRAQGLFTPSTLAGTQPPLSSPPHVLSSHSPRHSPPDLSHVDSSDGAASRPHSRHPSSTNLPLGAPVAKRPRPSDISSPAPSSIPATDFDQPPAKRPRVSNGPALPPLAPAPVLSKPSSSASQPPWATIKHESPSHNHARAVLVALNNDANPSQIIELLAAAPPSEDGIHTVLDEYGNNPLHWAASLALVPHVEALLAAGADIQRGNAAGETPLMRTVLSVAAAADNAFSAILPLLAPSLRTFDASHRSVLHHIAEVAGVKGRAASARMYMEAVLEWVARNQGGEFRTFVDAQDENGDTALCVAARVGNRALVRMLLDVGADRSIPNKLGLRPGDFGVEGQNLQLGSMEEVLGALRTRPSVPVQRSQDIIKDLTSMIQSLTSDFHAETKSKQDSLDIAQAQLRAATRELADQRRHIAAAQTRLGALDQARQRARNVSRAINDEDLIDWTGRTELDGTPAHVSRGVAFQYRGPGSTLGKDGPSDGEPAPIPTSTDVDPPIPPAGQDTVATLARLRRLKMWHARVEAMMQERLEATRGAGAEKEFQCKKIVSLCTGVPVDRVESMLENLLIAVESDGQGVDLNRVAGFMQKVRDGGL